jgi:hypothetical protein
LNLKQPVAGILATALVVVLSLGFIALWDAATFSGWVTYVLICMIPMEIVIGVVWQAKQPAFAASQTQPGRGILLALVMASAAAVVAPIYYYVAGGGISPPTPMLMQCTIVSVIVTFWGAIMWGGWPFTSAIKNPIAAGLTLLAASYVVNYLLFRVFFNYDFLKGAPVYVASLDPGGLYPGWNALVFYMAAIGIMFLMLHFDLWPLPLFPGLMKQPVLGIVWTIICLVLGGALFYVAIFVMGMDVVKFMVTVPVPFIFGTIVVLNMLQNSLFANLKQPVKGILNAAAAALAGTLLAILYRALMPSVSGALASGPPPYEAEIWLASALLGVTFPCLILYAEFFQFWPLKKA